MSAQVNEKIILGGKIYELEESTIRFPKDHPLIAKTEGKSFSTDCYRDYVGTWEIFENKLYLVAVEGDHYLLFGKACAEWYTGTLVIYTGTPINCSDFGHTSSIIIEVEVSKGVVVSYNTEVKEGRYCGKYVSYFDENENNELKNSLPIYLYDEDDDEWLRSEIT